MDPVTKVSVTFPDLNSPPFGGEEFQTNLIMPEPCPFLSRKLPVCSIIRPTETMHFQTWSDKAGNAKPLTAVDPVTKVSVTFPDLNSPPFGGEEFQTNLIMPEPCPFLSRKLPVCSIIRPTETKGIAMNVVNFLTAMGLFIGQSPAFFNLLRNLAQEADAARRGQLED